LRSQSSSKLQREPPEREKWLAAALIIRLAECFWELERTRIVPPALAPSANMALALHLWTPVIFRVILLNYLRDMQKLQIGAFRLNLSLSLLCPQVQIVQMRCYFIQMSG